MELKPILLKELYSKYEHIGSKENGKGLSHALGKESLKGVLLNQIAQELKNCSNWDNEKEYPPIKAIKEYMRLGERLSETKDGDGNEIVIELFNEKYYVAEGNHRIIALILLGEKTLKEYSLLNTG